MRMRGRATAHDLCVMPIGVRMRMQCACAAAGYWGCRYLPRAPRRRTPARFDQRELRGRHPGPQHARGAQFVAPDRQTAKRLAQRLDREARVEQRAEHHVARGAREAVEIQQS